MKVHATVMDTMNHLRSANSLGQYFIEDIDGEIYLIQGRTSCKIAKVSWAKRLKVSQVNDIVLYFNTGII